MNRNEPTVGLMFWYDPDKGETLLKVVKNALDRYKEKFGQDADTVRLPGAYLKKLAADMAKAEHGELSPTLNLWSSLALARGHFFVTREAGSDEARRAGADIDDA